MLGTFGASLSRNLLTGKGIVRAGSGNKKGIGIVRAGSRKQILRAGFGKQLDFDGASSFNKFWNTKIYKNEPTFNGVFSRNNLTK